MGVQKSSRLTEENWHKLQIERELVGNEQGLNGAGANSNVEEISQMCLGQFWPIRGGTLSCDKCQHTDFKNIFIQGSLARRRVGAGVDVEGCPQMRPDQFEAQEWGQSGRRAADTPGPCR